MRSPTRKPTRNGSSRPTPRSEPGRYSAVGRSFHLTTPHLHGPDVLALQWLLQQRGYFHGERDGDYGPLTAQAVYRAKFWRGYRKPDKAAGDMLVAYLKNERKPTPAMRARGVARKRRQAAVPLRQKALANLTRHLGEKEFPPGSNRVPWASTWYGVIGPWCAMSVSRAYVDAGSKAFAKGKRYAYVPYIVGDARAGRNSLTITTMPEPGDLVCYDWQGDHVSDHVGLFERWIAGGEGSEFLAVEGNTAVGNDSNGGEVMRRTRKRSQVQAFVHVGR
jgi:peptidoglycan hydrolase-like protein with peptidoglycan-binding domain